MKRINILVLIFIVLTNLLLFPKNIIIPKKIAKIGNEIILKNDVNKYAKLNEVSYNVAKKKLIEQAILYLSAKMYIEEPTEESINNQIKKDKAYYANISSKLVKYVSDEEFLANLHYNSLSMKSYKNDVKKTLWIKKFLHKTINQEKLKPYYPSDKEINLFIKNSPKLFEEKKGVILSMIYFSFYNEEANYKQEEDIQKLYKMSQICLKELTDGEKFEDMVRKYSDDLISLNNNPEGRIGSIALDDPRTLEKFSKEILDEFKKAKIGIIKKVFETKNGLYIFKINEKIKPKKLSDDAARIKANGYLQKIHKENLEKKVKDQLINELKEKIDIIIY